MMAQLGLGDYSDTCVELLGGESHYGPHAQAHTAREVVLRIAVRHAQAKALAVLQRECASSGTTGEGGSSNIFRSGDQPGAGGNTGCSSWYSFVALAHKACIAAASSGGNGGGGAKRGVWRAGKIAAVEKVPLQAFGKSDVSLSRRYVQAASSARRSSVCVHTGTSPGLSEVIRVCSTVRWRKTVE